jgi:hypothetical protein
MSTIAPSMTDAGPKESTRDGLIRCIHELSQLFDEETLRRVAGFILSITR